MQTANKAQLENGKRQQFQAIWQPILICYQYRQEPSQRVRQTEVKGKPEKHSTQQLHERPSCVNLIMPSGSCKKRVKCVTRFRLLLFPGPHVHVPNCTLRLKYAARLSITDDVSGRGGGSAKVAAPVQWSLNLLLIKAGTVKVSQRE